MYDIVVLGAGVVGLSTAVNIQTYLPDRQVVVIADKFNTETTSDGAAGIFAPSDPSIAKSESQFRKWSTDSFQWYHDLYHKHDPSVTGIQRLSGYQFTESKQEPPSHHEICYHFRDLTEMELRSFPGNKKYGWMYSSLMIECRKYLPWLTERFLSNGGRLVKKKIDDLSEFVGNCSVLVNCCGLGAGKLFNDADICPIRGYTVRVKAPWIKHFITNKRPDSYTYIFPGQDEVVLGGTLHKGEYDTSISGPWFDDIQKRCEMFLPGLKNAEVLAKWVGLRPYRAKLRLEEECIDVNGKQLKVVHNYGHGGSGVGLGWGTAVEAAQIVRDITQRDREKKSKL